MENIPFCEQIVPMIPQETELSEEQKQRWIWTFEKLSSTEMGLSLSEKVKLFCEANSPEEVEHAIVTHQSFGNVVRLAA